MVTTIWSGVQRTRRIVVRKPAITFAKAGIAGHVVIAEQVLGAEAGVAGEKPAPGLEGKLGEVRGARVERGAARHGAHPRLRRHQLAARREGRRPCPRTAAVGTRTGGSADAGDLDARAATALEQPLGGELVEGGDHRVPRDRKFAGEGADRRQPALRRDRPAEDQLAKLVAELAVQRNGVRGAQRDQVERVAELAIQTVPIRICRNGPVGGNNVSRSVSEGEALDGGVVGWRVRRAFLGCPELGPSRAGMSVRIGINPITWTNDDVPELGGDTPLEVCLAETREAGYLGTELGGKFPRDSAVLGPILKRYDLRLVGGWWDGRILEREVDAEFEALLPHLTLHRDLGAKHVVYADTSRGRHGGIWEPISKRPMLGDDEWPAYGRKVTALAEKMAEFGVGMAFHHHMGTIVETDAEVDRLMAVTGAAVGLLYDTGHSAFSGGDPVALATRHVEAHRPCPLQGHAARHPRAGAARRHELHAGRARRHLHRARRRQRRLRDDPKRLHDAGYDGWLVVEAEQDPRKAHPLTYAKLGYRNLVALAEAAGFAVETREAV